MSMTDNEYEKRRQAEIDQRSLECAAEICERAGTTPAKMFNEAKKSGAISPECCNGCGNEARRLHMVVDGTYAGFRYCRPCMMQHLAMEYAWKHRNDLARTVEVGE